MKISANIRIYIPILATLVLIIFYKVDGKNFYHNILSFILGDNYAISGVALGVVTLSCVAWAAVQHFIPSQDQSQSTTTTLYKISGFRAKQLESISATTYNEASQQIIANLKPTPEKDAGQEKKQVEHKKEGNNQSKGGRKQRESSAPTKPVSSITGSFENNKTPNTQSEQGNSDQNSTQGNDPLANINTAIKGVSQINGSNRDKIISNIKVLPPKNKKAENIQA